MALPNINTFFVDEKEIGLFWKASPKTNILKWNLYGSPTADINLNDPVKGVVFTDFELVAEGIPNSDTQLTPGSVYYKLTREDLGIAEKDPYYFYITSVDSEGTESALEKDNLHAVPYKDDHYVDETAPVNLHYKSFEFTLTAVDDAAGDIDRFLNIVSLMGRPAKMLRIQVVSGPSITMRINSFMSDAITIDGSDPIPFTLHRTEVILKKLWISKSVAGDSVVKLYVAG
jgi:hypothetical protein